MMRKDAANVTSVRPWCRSSGRNEMAMIVYLDCACTLAAFIRIGEVSVSKAELGNILATSTSLN